MMRKYFMAAIAVFTAVAVGGTAFGASTTTKGEVTHGMDFQVSPSKQPKKKWGPATLYARTGPSVRTSDPENGIPAKTERVRMLFDKHIRFNTGQFPTCKVDISALENTTPSQAMQRCGRKSKVSNDKRSAATARLGFGGGSAVVDLNFDVMGFNGKPVGTGKRKNPTLYLHVRDNGTGDAATETTTMLLGVLRNAPGKPYGTMLDVDNIPGIAGATGGLNDFFATIKKTRKKSGKKVHFIQARCRAKNWKLKAIWNFRSEPNVPNQLSGTDQQRCKKK
jgi:hypothetical protein